MGNDKQIFFEGSIRKADMENPFWSSDPVSQLLQHAHGDHACVKVFKNGYLNANDSQDDDAYVIGVVITHSTRGYDVVDYLSTHLHNFKIVGRDSDWTDVIVWHDEYNIIKSFTYKPELDKSPPSMSIALNDEYVDLRLGDLTSRMGLVEAKELRDELDNTILRLEGALRLKEIKK